MSVKRETKRKSRREKSKMYKVNKVEPCDPRPLTKWHKTAHKTMSEVLLKDVWPFFGTRTVATDAEFRAKCANLLAMTEHLQKMNIKEQYPFQFGVPIWLTIFQMWDELSQGRESKTQKIVREMRVLNRLPDGFIAYPPLKNRKYPKLEEVHDVFRERFQCDPETVKAPDNSILMAH
jgi:hypothetical protein